MERRVERQRRAERQRKTGRERLDRTKDGEKG